jgi:hypothetical protein
MNSVRSPGPEIYEGSEDLRRKIRRSSKSVLLALHRSRGENKLPTTRLKRKEKLCRGDITTSMD